MTYNSFFLFLILLFNCCSHLTSQNETKKWYFGQNAGLDFATNPPTILTNGAMNSSEGCASISDAAGNLLFYTDSYTIWNQAHAVMANGTNVGGNIYYSTITQAAIILKQPGNANIYYVIVNDGGSSIFSGTGLKYAIVDMSLAAGMGSVTAKGIVLQVQTTEKTTAVKHCNGTDIWILSHDWNSNNFRAHLLTATGINANPVITSIGSTHSVAAQWCGQMRLSPNGKKIALAINVNSASPYELFDFDNSTGILSNSVTLGANPNSYAANDAYSVEFSPDGTKLYGGTWGSSSILYQWDLCSGSNAAIAASEYTVSNGPFIVGSLQLAPNGKIYDARQGTSVLGVINNPNMLGSACNYVNLGQSVSPQFSNFGLPNFMCSYFNAPATSTITYTQNCKVVAFGIQTPTGSCNAAAPPILNTMWTFGDPVSGAANTSALNNPNHTFSGAGTYTVKLVLYYPCGSDTIIKTIMIAASPALSVSGTTNICSGISATLQASGADSYSWSNNSTAQNITVTPNVTTTYTVTGTNTLTGCSSSGTIAVTVSKCLSITNFEKEGIWLNIFPNPVKDDFTNLKLITDVQRLDYHARLIDVLGREVSKRIELIAGETTPVTLYGLKHGIYIMQIFEGDRFLKSEKIIRE